MKKVLLTLALGLAGLVGAKAQISKGNVMVGANMAGFNVGLNEGDGWNISISPKAAWFVQDNWALGGEVMLGFSGAKNAKTATNYGVNALTRYYFNDGANEIMNSSRFFGEATVGINGRDYAGSNTNGLGFSFGPGYSYFINRNVAVEALLKYNGIVGFGSEAYQHNLGFGVGLQIFLPGRATARKVDRDAR